MTSRLCASALPSAPRGFGAGAVLTAAALTLFLAACGDKKEKDKPASQTAAKVNKEEITVHQINFLLQQQRGLAPEQAASAGKLALERLIDQELAIQKAQDQKLDRDPRVVQQIEAVRREIIARAYADKIAAGAPKPSPAEIKAYYDSHPALFSERRVYNLQELAIQAAPAQVDAVRAKLVAAKDIPEFVDYLKTNDIKFSATQALRTAEQLPLASLDKFAQMKDGQTIFTNTPTGAQVMVLLGARSQPVDEARATPAIEQFLLNDRKRKVVEDDLKALRTAAKVEYLGEYAKGAKEAAPAAATAPEVPLTSVAPPAAAGSMPMAAPPVEVEPINRSPASSPAAGTLEKGIKGFK
jgi:EpsD family peptidyl-prolyl cis-trans isomerase